MDDLVDNKATRGCFGVAGFLTVAVAVTATVVVWLAGLGTVATAGTAVCSMFTAVLGAAMCVWGIRGFVSEDRSDAEEAILRVAKRSGGSVQVSTVAAETDLSLREADDLLDELAREGVARLEIDEEGRELYAFPGIEEAEIDDQGKVIFDDRDFDLDKTMRKAAKTAKHVIDRLD